MAISLPIHGHDATLSRNRSTSGHCNCCSMLPHVSQPITPPLDTDGPPFDARHVNAADTIMCTDDLHMLEHEHEHKHGHARDWTQDLPQTAHVDLLRATDWARNGLGPLDAWGDTLRLFTGFVMADSRAACLWWGPSAVAIYNQHFVPLCARVHPMLMGSTYAEGLPELWPAISGLFEESKRTGLGQNVSSNEPLLVERNGWKEEAFFSGSFVPIGPTHQPLGF